MKTIGLEPKFRIGDTAKIDKRFFPGLAVQHPEPLRVQEIHLVESSFPESPKGIAPYFRVLLTGADGYWCEGFDGFFKAVSNA